MIAYATNGNSEGKQLRQAASFFKQNYFTPSIKEVVIRPDQNLSKFFSSFFGPQKDHESDETSFDVRLELRTSERTFVLRPCKISNKVQCGWMMMSCFENKFSASPSISRFTRGGNNTLVYTYDEVKASLCAERQARVLGNF